MFCVGNEELKGALGETITCPHCGAEHLIEYGDTVLPDGSKVKSKILSFYKCGGNMYLAGIHGRAI